MSATAAWPRALAARLLVPLVLVLGAGCAEEVAGAAPQGLRPTKPPPELVAPAPARAAPDPGFTARAARLTERFRAAIARRIEGARKESHGKADAGNVRVAVCVRELGAPTELVSLGADEPHMPASNLKLVTTAAALVLLGREAAWVTPVEATGPVRDGVLAGDLVVRAAGDPLCDPSGEGRVEERLRALAAELAGTGLRRVEGALVLDEGAFEAPAPGPAWPDPSQRWAEYCALAGGFSANGGVLHARVRAGAVGANAAIEVHPEPHGLERSYGVKTSAGSKVDVRVGATARTATVRGTLGADIGEYEAEFAHPDPVQLFGELLADALRRQGVVVAGGLRRARGAPAGVRLGELRSPLVACLEPINAESRNGVADQLFLSLGEAVTGAGTRAGGGQAVGQALERLGVGRTNVRQVDGSGLSREDRVTARAIAALLERVLSSDRETARLYRASLAVAGEKGTLEDRLRGTRAQGRVFAKTGWITGVSALSGYAEPSGHGPLVFSILIEYPSELGGLNTSVFKPLQDELVLLLFEDDA